MHVHCASEVLYCYTLRALQPSPPTMTIAITTLQTMNLPLLIVTVMMAMVHVDHPTIVISVRGVQTDSMMEFDPTPVCVEVPALMPIMSIASVGVDSGTRVVPMRSTHAQAVRVSDQPGRAVEVPLLIVVRPVAVIHPNPSTIVVSLACIETFVAMSWLDSRAVCSHGYSCCILPPLFVVSFPDFVMELVFCMTLSVVNDMALMCYFPPYLMPLLSLVLVSICNFLPHALVPPCLAVPFPSNRGCQTLKCHPFLMCLFPFLPLSHFLATLSPPPLLDFKLLVLHCNMHRCMLVSELSHMYAMICRILLGQLQSLIQRDEGLVEDLITF